MLDAGDDRRFLRAAADGADIAIGVVERRALLRAPAADPAHLARAFAAGAYSGANLFLLGSPKVAPAIELWRSVEQDRKKGWRLLLALGPAAVARRRAPPAHARPDAGARSGRKLGLDIRAVDMADPLAAVDVDKPDDHALVEAILEGRA